MIDNNCEIILASFMAFKLSFGGKRPSGTSENPSLYTPQDDVADDFQLRETSYDEEINFVRARPRCGPSPPPFPAFKATIWVLKAQI